MNKVLSLVAIFLFFSSSFAQNVNFLGKEEEPSIENIDVSQPLQNSDIELPDSDIANLEDKEDLLKEQGLPEEIHIEGQVLSEEVNDEILSEEVHAKPQEIQIEENNPKDTLIEEQSLTLENNGQVLAEEGENNQVEVPQEDNLVLPEQNLEQQLP